MFELILDETLKETTVHGSREFPFEIYFGGVAMFAEGYLDWHWHDYFEINFVASGNLHYFIENKEYFLQEGDAIFINSGRLHRGYSDNLTQVSNTIVFDGTVFCEDTSSEWYSSLIQEFVHSDINGLILTPDIPWMKAVLDKLKAMYGDYQKQNFASKLSVKGYLCTIFAEILNNTAHTSCPTALNTEKMKRMRKLLSYIAQNYMNPITLTDLASAAGLSDAECSRFFSSQMNQSPFSYLNQYRIERSCELLVNTDLSISDIALRSGFNSFSYYGKRFREKMHCTPSEYREKIWEAVGNGIE